MPRMNAPQKRRRLSRVSSGSYSSGRSSRIMSVVSPPPSPPAAPLAKVSAPGAAADVAQQKQDAERGVPEAAVGGHEMKSRRRKPTTRPSAEPIITAERTPIAGRLSRTPRTNKTAPMEPALRLWSDARPCSTDRTTEKMSSKAPAIMRRAERHRSDASHAARTARKTDIPDPFKPARAAPPTRPAAPPPRRLPRRAAEDGLRDPDS